MKKTTASKSKKASEVVLIPNESIAGLFELTQGLQSPAMAQLKRVLIKDLTSPDSYIMAALSEKINLHGFKMEKAPAAKLGKHSVGFTIIELDEDELAMGPSAIKSALKNESVVNAKISLWKVVIDGATYSPLAIYRAALVAAGFKLEPQYNTRRALNWLAHHGYSPEKV